MTLEILRLTERVDIAREIGESHFREFKSGLEGKPGEKTPRKVKEVCIDIARTLVAFANADGGELLVGVEDDGNVTGLDYTDEQLETLLAASRTHVLQDTPLPIGRTTKVVYQDKTILYFSVPKGIDYIYLTSDGRCLQRRELESVPIPAEQISFTRAEKTSREYDRDFVEGANLSDLDTSIIASVASQISKGMSIERCLQHLELSEFDGKRFMYKKAALLLFAKNPSRWHPRLQVRVLKVDGTEIKTGESYNVVYDEEVSDNILKLLEASWELIRPNLTETRISSNAIFRTQIIYPELACREALINAIAHRDYSVEGRGIEVHIYSDRMEVISPGGLLSSLSIDDLKQLKGAHQSRNSLVARVLREVGYMRELGEGIRRIYELMTASDLTSPELKSSSSTFSVTLYQKYIYSREEKIWLESFNRFNLNRDQRTVVRLGYNGRLISASDIYDAVGVVDTDYYRQLIESLRRLGVLSNALTKSQVNTKAESQKIPKKKVPRYLVILPMETATSSVGEPDPEALDDADYAQVYIGNIPQNVNETELIKAFSIYGDVVNVYIPKIPNSNLNKGFAFIEFERQKAANQAISESDKVQLKGRKLVVNEAFKKVATSRT